MISLDTETTGIDFRHGARPFFVTACLEDGEQRWWEWDVDPMTRAIIVPSEELEELRELIMQCDGIVMQNAKFDFTAFEFCLALQGDEECDAAWSKTDDTLIAAHLLESNQPHDLTSLGVRYLGVNIQHLEVALRKACDEARRWARTNRPEWRIAKAGLPEMPSAKEECWKFDTWLPRLVADERDDPPDHPWRTVLRDYANADSALTWHLWPVMKQCMESRSLMRIYQERMKVLPIAWRMERRGVTVSSTRLEELRTNYVEESSGAARLCVNIAASFGHQLTMPKGASPNNSLRQFMFEVLKVEPMRGKKAKTDAPTLNRAAMGHYLGTLPPRSKAWTFVDSLLGKRSRDTAIAYMEGYRRFWKQTDDEGFFVLYPSLNPTGTDTLRWSGSNPNQQNISKKEGFNLRHCFGPAPGREWWSLDARNIELRIPAYSANESEMIALFERPDDAPYFGSNHLLNFHTVYPEIWDEVLKEVGNDKVGSVCKKRFASSWYQWCKNGGFAVLYGAMDRPDGNGTADIAFHRPGAHAKLKARFSRMEALNQRCIRQADRYGYVETMPDRNVDPERGYPLLCARTENDRVLPTVPLNYYSQGTAMWWMMKAMIRVDAQLVQWRREGFDAHIVMQVHDELVLDFPLSRCDPREDVSKTRPDGMKLIRKSNLWRVKQIQKLMELGGDDIGLPTPTSCEWHPVNWSEGHSL